MAKYKITAPTYVTLQGSTVGTHYDASPSQPALLNLPDDYEPSVTWVALDSAANSAKQKVRQLRTRPYEARLKEAEAASAKAQEEAEAKEQQQLNNPEAFREQAGGIAPPPASFLPEAHEPFGEKHGKALETNKQAGGPKPAKPGAGDKQSPL